MSSHDLTLRCTCGLVRGVYRKFGAGDRARAICMCDDCQAYAHFLGHADSILDANGGTDIVPLRPARFEITQGLEHLACLRLSEKGLNRFFASCCKTPIANSPTSQLPYLGVVHTFMEAKGPALDELVGPVREIMQAKYAVGTPPAWASKTVSLGFMARTALYIAKGLFQKLQRPNLFFKEDGRPSVRPYILTSSEREALRPLCGPQSRGVS